MNRLRKLVNAFSPYANEYENTLQNFLKSLTEKSNKTQTIERLLVLAQQNLASLNLWSEFRYKGYVYLNKNTRKTLYKNLELIENDFNNYYKKHLQTEEKTSSENNTLKNSEKIRLLTCIMDYFSITRGLYIYQESSSFGKLLQDPNLNNLIGDCNQIVTLYIYLYSKYFSIKDLKLRTLPGHVALHFEGRDIEATKGEFVNYSKTDGNKLLPIHEIVSINLLDVSDSFLKTKPLDPNYLLQASRLAFLLSSNQEVVTHNLNASYGTVINSLMKLHNFEKALIFAKQSNNNSYFELIGNNGAVYNINKHNFIKARKLAKYAKNNQDLIKYSYQEEGKFYYDKGNFDASIKAFSMIGDQEAIKTIYKAMFVKEQNKLPKNLNSENIKNYKKNINNMNFYAKKSNDKSLVNNVQQYSKLL